MTVDELLVFLHDRPILSFALLVLFLVLRTQKLEWASFRRHVKTLSLYKRRISRFESLPVDVHLRILEDLSHDDVQPHLDRMIYLRFKQGQRHLLNVCLVSKRMEEIARPYLYRAAILDDVDVLARLFRTLGERPALGAHFKRLLLDVPFSEKDARYRKPHVAVLKPRQNHKQACKPAAEASGIIEYLREVDISPLARLVDGDWITGVQFQKWASEREYTSIGMMYSEILLRTHNIESLSFGTLDFTDYYSFRVFKRLLDRLGLRYHMGLGRRSWRPSVMAPTQLKELQLLEGNQSSLGTEFLMDFLRLPSLRKIDYFRGDTWWRDNGDLEEALISWGYPEFPSFQYSNITCVNLQRTHCQPSGIFQICSSFPCLEYLSISTPYDMKIRTTGGLRSHGKSISAGLAKLEQLRELVLDLHYKDDVKAVLGQHGVINLSGLNKLVKVRIPLHFLVELQPGNEPAVTNLDAALPRFVKQLTVWGDMDSVRTFSRRKDHYSPRNSALDLLYSLSVHLADHFKHLEEITYCYRDQALSAACCCDTHIVCKYCKASLLLDPHTSCYYSWVKSLSQCLENLGIYFNTVEEQE